METSPFEPGAYLERVRLTRSVTASEEGLEALHRAQAYAVPFENFDILLGRGISLEPDAIFDKLVRRARGGYCFELNNLLLMALTHFGFDVRPLLARVHISGTPSGRGHMLLLATIGGREWIADVGFGGPGLRAPIPLEPGRTALQDGQAFRLVEVERFGTMLQSRRSGSWQDLYSFDKDHVIAQDIAYGNHFTSTHPSSFFTFSRVATMPRPDGRVSLLDLTLRTVSNGTEHEQQLGEGQAYLETLAAQFGIELAVPYVALRPLSR
jgi:N-hydroxyarylamine O-acetyltransferase